MDNINNVVYNDYQMKFLNDLINDGEGFRKGNGSAALFSELGLLASLVNAM